MASIIKLFIIIILFISNSIAEDNNIKHYSEDMGTLAIMYHRFNENKYPSTNIQIDVFQNQIKIINQFNFKFLDPGNFQKNFAIPKKEKKILLTIDDAFLSFYEHAWPLLKKDKIPFILFVSTEAVGKFGYMSWKQIKEIEKENFAYIGNHSHTHEYLVDLKKNDFLQDLEKANKIFIEELGYNPKFFSYPFGEYNEFIKDYISKNFDFAFGQHSGVIDINKNKYELPRFPINEKYGDLARFKFLVNLYPLQFKSMSPKNKMVENKNNPPNFSVEFFKVQKNLRNINCYSDEGNKWMKSNIFFKDNILFIKFRDKFLFRRGRVNCSLNDDGVWRWFGIQFSIK
ncbi:polysaccharide deacetylase family protein [Candidatus Pelagibacter sp.]|nr:polysaccharide deacetylase family protein [Candidatus Pelagibacter sp.]